MSRIVLISGFPVTANQMTTEQSAGGSAIPQCDTDTMKTKSHYWISQSRKMTPCNQAEEGKLINKSIYF